jgi:hypothetical protein
LASLGLDENHLRFPHYRYDSGSFGLTFGLAALRPSASFGSTFGLAALRL